MSRSLGGTSLTTRSPIRSVPELISSSPAIMRNSVDLPQPDGPTSTSSSPSATSKLAPATPTTPFGYTLRRLSSWTLAIGSPVPDPPGPRFCCPPSRFRPLPALIARRPAGIALLDITLARFVPVPWHEIVPMPTPDPIPRTRVDAEGFFVPEGIPVGGGHRRLPDRRITAGRRRRPEHLDPLRAHTGND